MREEIQWIVVLADTNNCSVRGKNLATHLVILAGTTKLMAHWHKVLPDDILTVQHEDVLDDLEGQVKRVLAFCGLEFEEACLAFHKTKRVIKTPSSEQVRQPIYKTGMGQWKPFESNLGELKRVLADK